MPGAALFSVSTTSLGSVSVSTTALPQCGCFMSENFFSKSFSTAFGCLILSIIRTTPVLVRPIAQFTGCFLLTISIFFISALSMPVSASAIIRSHAVFGLAGPS